jgi:multiple sugar transport system permease protein
MDAATVTAPGDRPDSPGRAAKVRPMGAIISPTIAYRFAGAAVLLLVALLLAPMVLVILLSLTDYELGATGLRFVGLDNYATLVGEETFWRQLTNTLSYVAMVVPGSVGLALLLAVVIDSLTKGKRFYQVAIFLPVTATLVPMAVVWKYLLHGRIGPVNHFLGALGLPPVEFFGDPSLVMVSLAIIGIWQLTGFNMVLFTAALRAVPQDLYEAAAVDGADGPIDRFRAVTFPMIGPTTMFVVVTSFITAFKVFESVAVLTHGGPRGASDVLLYGTYREGFEYLNMAGAAALTVVFLAIILVLSLVQSRLIDKKVHYR